MELKTILLDLDGVLNIYNGEFNEYFIPPVKEGAKEFLQILSHQYKIIIFTTRNRLVTAKWLSENNLNEFVHDISNVKIPAYLHIDDRAVCHQGDFEKTLECIEGFKVHWQV